MLTVKWYSLQSTASHTHIEREREEIQVECNHRQRHVVEGDTIIRVNGISIGWIEVRKLRRIADIILCCETIGVDEAIIKLA